MIIENYMKSNVTVLKESFIGTHLFIYVLCMAAFTLQWQSNCSRGCMACKTINI